MSNSIKKRLAIFLDGTWNTEDDSTNVLNAYHNTVEGLIQEKNKKGEVVDIIQKRYYDRGVGTSVLENIRGGGFGLGLEKNVREAYNWLVDNYNHKDQIYIFGFSRGAYTARSLAGLIAACGLVRRGAPITVTQLWNGYAFISNNRDHNKDYDWWKKTLKKKKNKNYFGRITDLYNREADQPLINKSEKLLIQWSARVDINYLGIYDTVGAMGVHALGIPGLKSKLDQNHNLNPSGLFKKCRHALAIDEHRSSFRLTPILDHVFNVPKPKEKIDYYDNKIEQMWFAGAHSNIGGGYANNVLSMQPYNWIFEGAEDAGLKMLLRNAKVKKTSAEDPDTSDIRDSFAELAGAIYPHIIRAKRNFRPIGRADLVRADYTLRPINEKIHSSVFDIGDLDKNYAPPNVLAYLKKHPEKHERTTFSGRSAQHQWPGEIMAYGEKDESIKNYLLPRILLVLWSILAALGLIRIAQFFWIGSFNPCWCVLPIIASLFVLGDWGEYKVTLAKNFYPKAVRLEVFWNILYWMRLLGILCFFIGAFCVAFACVNWDTNFNLSITGLWEYIKSLLTNINHPSFIAAFISTTIIMSILDSFGQNPTIELSEEYIDIDPKHLQPKASENKQGKLIAKLSFIVILAIFIYLIVKFWNLVPDISSSVYLDSGLLLIFVLLLAFPPILDWVGKPMGKYKANLGTIVRLQTAFTKNQVTSIFNSWLKDVYRTWITDDDEKDLKKLNLNDKIKNDEDKKKVLAWVRLREVMRLALWRDTLGFVPLYSFFLGTILCIGSTLYCNYVENVECYQLFGKIPLWLALVLITAVFDVLENWIHLIHIKNHPKGGSSQVLILIGTICTILKTIGFLTMVLVSIVILFFTCKIVLTDVGGWKWMIATIFTYFMIFSLIPLAYNFGKRLFFDPA